MKNTIWCQMWPKLILYSFRLATLTLAQEKKNTGLRSEVLHCGARCKTSGDVQRFKSNTGTCTTLINLLDIFFNNIETGAILSHQPSMTTVGMTWWQAFSLLRNPHSKASKESDFSCSSNFANPKSSLKQETFKTIIIDTRFPTPFTFSFQILSNIFT